jgi:type VII secretion-associated serine protease mycosin
MTIAAGTTLALAGPARADIVRQRQQWVLDAIDARAAWQLSQGRGVTVAVIDSGVDPTIADLAGSVITGPDLTGVHTPFSDPNWGIHGTWMASLIAGHGHGAGGQDGIVGVAPQARILSIRVITDRSDPGYQAYQDEPPDRGQHELATAIRYAVRHHAGVISMSLGYNEPSLIVRDALQYALTHNVVVVASSGNSGTAQTAQGQGHAPYSFPADYPGVIGVAAVGRSGQPAYFSSDNLSVEVAAPGVNVPAAGRQNQYWVVSGTSPACALVAGVAALIRSRYPTLTAPQIRRSIIWSASHRPQGGYDDEVGFGTVDAYMALKFAARVVAEQHHVRLATAKSLAGFFGGGKSEVPPVPVPPRDRASLYLLALLALGCLLLLAGSIWRLAGTGPGRRHPAHRAGGPAPGWEPAPHPTRPFPVPASYSQNGYPQQPSYPQPGYPQQNYQQPAYQEPGHEQPGYPQPGYPQPGYYPLPQAAPPPAQPVQPPYPPLPAEPGSQGPVQ